MLTKQKIRDPPTRARRQDHRARGDQAPHRRGHGQDSTRRDYLYAEMVDPAIRIPASTRSEAARRVREAWAATAAGGEDSAATAAGEGASAPSGTAGPSVQTPIVPSGGQARAKKPRKSRAKKAAVPELHPEMRAVIDRMNSFMDLLENVNSPSTAPPAPSTAPAVPPAPTATAAAPMAPMAPSLPSVAPTAAAPAQVQQLQTAHWQFQSQATPLQPIQYAQFTRPADQPHTAAQDPGVPYRTTAESPMYHPAVNFQRSHMYGGPRTDFSVI